MSNPARPPAFFASAARELVAQTRGLPQADLESRVAVMLAETFESGMASTLTAVVTSIEAVKVPVNGMVLFKVPDGMPVAQVDVFRRDLHAIARMLKERMGHSPILLVVPDACEAQVVEFESDDADEGTRYPTAFPGQTLHPIGEPDAGELLQGPWPAPSRTDRRIVALDPLKLRDLVIDVLPDDIEGTVSVLPMGASVVEGVAHHDIRIVLPRDAQLLAVNDGRTVVSAEWVARLEEVVEGFSAETNAHFEVTVILDNEPAREDSPRFAVAPAAG